jgi:two-component system cell cycle sensor histidine kinase/response regulator CckA
MKKYTPILLLAILLLAWPAYAADPVRVGVYNNGPLSFVDDDGVPQGLTVDLLNEVAQAEGLQLEYVPCDWAGCIAMLDGGEIDLLGPTAYTKERATRYDFNQETILANWGHVYIPTGSARTTFTDLRDRRVALLAGDIHAQAFTTLMTGFDIPFEPLTVNTYEAVFEALDSGAADAGVVNRVFALQHEQNYRVQSSPMIFNPIETRWATLKGQNPDLLAAIDRNMAAWKQNQHSIYYRTLDKWFSKVSRQVVPVWLWWLLGLGCAVIALALGGNILLRDQVHARTRELQAEVLERRQAEAAHQAAERKFRDLFNNIHDAVLVHPMPVDGFDPFLEVNDAACEMYGYSREQFKALTAHHLFDPKGGTPQEINYQRRRMLLEQGTLTFETIHYASDGRPIPVEVRARLSTVNEQPVVFSVMRNVSQQKAMLHERDMLAAQLLQAQKMEAVGRLAGGVAHDLNNLLSPILGFSELLLTQQHADPTQTEAIRTIRQVAVKAKKLVAQLLAFGRKQILTIHPVDVNRLVADFLPLLRQMIPPDIELLTDLNPDLPLVEADTNQLEQVVLNLIVNARDAMPDGGRLSVSTGRQELPQLVDPVNKAELLPGGWYVVLSVSDSGTGIAPEYVEHIFEPFFTTKEQGKGTGLGLATAYGIIRQHHGTIRVRSVAGKGSTFSVYLPQSEAAVQTVAPTVAPEPAAVTARSNGRETVLLVEDDPHVGDVAQAALTQLGYTVLRADSGPAALRLLDSHDGPLDLMLTDVQMPEMDGKALYRQVKAAHPGLKVLFMSGYTDDVIRWEDIPPEDSNFLQKPFSLRLLATEIDRILGTSD